MYRHLVLSGMQVFNLAACRLAMNSQIFRGDHLVYEEAALVHSHREFSEQGCVAVFTSSLLTSLTAQKPHSPSVGFRWERKQSLQVWWVCLFLY